MTSHSLQTHPHAWPATRKNITENYVQVSSIITVRKYHKKVETNYYKVTEKDAKYTISTNSTLDYYCESDM